MIYARAQRGSGSGQDGGTPRETASDKTQDVLS
jgi:hypothetical protein